MNRVSWVNKGERAHSNLRGVRRGKHGKPRRRVQNKSLVMSRFKFRWALVALLPLLAGVGMANLGSWRPRRVRVVGAPFQVAFSPDGSHVALASDPDGSGRVEMWRVASGSRFGGPTVSEHFSFAVRRPRSICFSGDSAMLLCTGDFLHRFDLKTGKLMRPVNTHDAGGGFAHSWPQPDAVTTASDGGWEQRDTRSGRVQRRLGSPDDADEPTDYVLALAPDGETSAWPVDYKSVIVLRNSRTMRKRRLPALIDDSSKNLSCNITALTFSPDSRLLAVAWSADVYNAKGINFVSSRVTMWDLKTFKIVAKWIENDKPINAHAFSPDGFTLAAARDDGAISLRSAKTGKLERLLKTAGQEVTSVAYSPDGQTLASCSSDGALYLWRVK